jgi:hypothetical protein
VDTVPDNFEQATVAKPTDAAPAAAQALASDAYKPGDNSSKNLSADSAAKDTSTANSLFGSLHFFDSSSDSKPAAAAKPTDGSTPAAALTDSTAPAATAAPTDGTAPAAATATDATSVAKLAAPADVTTPAAAPADAATPTDAATTANAPSDSSSTSTSFLDKLSSIVSAGGANDQITPGPGTGANDQITQVTGTGPNGTTEVLGVGPITVSTPDPFDWRHPIDSAKTFIEHPIDSTEQHIQHQVEAVKDLYDRATAPNKPAETKAPYDSPEKAHVTDLESKISDPAKQAQFQKDMSDFEKRAGDAHPPLDPKEVAETYKQVGRLMDAKDSSINLSDTDRQTVAEQILHHAANPDRIDQGNHDTCAAAALESQMFAKDPAAASKMIVDVAVSGQYVGHDQTCVTPDAKSLAGKDGHNMDYPPADNQRTMASQIFQTTAATMIYRDYKQEAPEQNGPQDTGERIGNGKDFPGLTNDQVRDINQRVTGKDNGDTVIANEKDRGDSTGGVYVSSPEQLNDSLAKLKEAGKLPAIISVDSRNEPFFGDSKGNVAGGSGGPHDVTIKDYIPGNPAQVVIENQWGKDSEHTMPVDQLYHATLPPGDPQTIAALKTQVGATMDNSSGDPGLKLELLRQEHMATNPADQITDQQYQQQVAQVMVNAEKGWQQQAEGGGKVDEEQRKDTWYKFNELALGDGGGAVAFGRNLGADLRQEKNPELAQQLIADQQKYSKEFLASMNAQKGHTTDG